MVPLKPFLKIIALAFVFVLISGCSAVTQQTAFREDSFNPKGTEDFRFVVMGDNRPWSVDYDDIVTQNGFFLGNIGRANATKADFAVIVGDSVLGYTRDSELIGKEWDAFEETCKLFDMPYVSVIGNHDVWDEQSQAIRQKRYGPLYFSWDHKGCHFIALNSEMVGQLDIITGAQLEWLKNDLERAVLARRIFVFIHKPLWLWDDNRRWDNGSEEEINRNQWNTIVHPLLAKYHVDTVFAGHIKRYRLYPQKDGVNYVVSGGAGEELPLYELAGGFFHFLKVDVAGNSSSFRVVRKDDEFPANCVTSESVEELKNSMKLDVLGNLSKGNGATVRASINNPTDYKVRGFVMSDLGGSSWSVKANEVVIQPKSQATIEIEISYKDFFPFPDGLEVRLLDKYGTHSMYGWLFLDDILTPFVPLITEWNVVGPFSLGIKNLDIDKKISKEKFLEMSIPAWDNLLEPELKTDFAASYKGKNGDKISWQVFKGFDNGFIYLDSLYGKQDFFAAYCVSYIYSPSAQECVMALGSNDGISLRINGKDVWRKRDLGEPKRDRDLVTVNLQKGWNEVGVKIIDCGSTAGFFLRIMNFDGEPKFSTKPS